jgi:hypothetical protein
VTILTQRSSVGTKWEREAPVWNSSVTIYFNGMSAVSTIASLSPSRFISI